jgi:hypothetical protein
MRCFNVRSPVPRLLGLGLLLALAHVPVNAASLTTDKAFGSFMLNVTGANQQTVNFGSNGQAVLSTASGNLVAEAVGTVPIAGKALPVTVSARPTMLTIAKGIGSALSKFVPVLAAGVALYDLAREFSYTPYHATDGSVYILKDMLQSTYRVTCQAGTIYGELDSIGNTCMSAMQIFQRTHGYSSCTYGNLAFPVVSGSKHFTFNQVSGSCGNYSFDYVAAFQSSTLRQDPATIEDLQNAIAAKSGWPSNSKLTDAVVQAAPYLEPATFTQSKTVIGPATRQDGTTTTTNPDGTTTTKTTTQNITYQGDTINYTTNVVTSNYNPVTNNTTTQQSTSTEKPAEPAQTDCDKNPDAAGCIKLGDTPSTSDELPRKNFDLTVTPVAFADNAACPQPVSFTFMGQTHQFGYQPICDQLVSVKALILVLAGFMAAFIIADGFRVQS